jgi:hypothetical protein
MGRGRGRGNLASLFSPTASQWNQLVRRVSRLSRELSDAHTALLRVATESDDQMKNLDDQVLNLRGSVGKHPAVLNPNVLGMELRTSVVGISDDLQGVKDKVDHPVHTSLQVSTREIADRARKEARLAFEGVSRLENSKTGLAKDHKPLESIVEGMVTGLYEPSGMYNHLLTSSAERLPIHPTVDRQQDLDKIWKEIDTIKMMKGLGSANDGPSDPVISAVQSSLRQLEASLKTIKASLGGELVHVDSETFHSAKEVEGWVVENMGSGSGFPDSTLCRC